MTLNYTNKFKPSNSINLSPAWTCALGNWRLEVCLGLMLCISEFVKYCSILLDTNVSRESIYCGINGKMFNSLNKILQDSLVLHPIINLIAFLYSKYLNTVGRISPEYYSISHYSVGMYETMSISTGFYPNLDIWNANKL